VVEINEDPTAPWPKFMHIFPLILRSVEADRGGDEPMPCSQDFEIADVDNNLSGETVVPGRNEDGGTGLACTTGRIRGGLPALDIANDAVDYCTNILVRVSDGPFRYVVIILACHVILLAGYLLLR
jgi:hypothetical protein